MLDWWRYFNLTETQTLKTYQTESNKYCIIITGINTKISKTHWLLNKILFSLCLSLSLSLSLSVSLCLSLSLSVSLSLSLCLSLCLSVYLSLSLRKFFLEIIQPFSEAAIGGIQKRKLFSNILWYSQDRKAHVQGSIF